MIMLEQTQIHLPMKNIFYRYTIKISTQLRCATHIMVLLTRVFKECVSLHARQSIVIKMYRYEVRFSNQWQAALNVL